MARPMLSASHFTLDQLQYRRVSYMGKILAGMLALTITAILSSGTYLHAQETAPVATPAAPAPTAPVAPAVEAPAEPEKKMDGEKAKKLKKGKKGGKGKKKGKEKKNG